MATTTQSIFVAVSAACFGGVFVAIGLLLETWADKKWFKNQKSHHYWECSKKFGEWFVIIGVLIEVVVAGWTAKNEWEIDRTLGDLTKERISDPKLNDVLKSIS